VRTRSYNVGRIIVALGAIWLFASLFMPWYRLDVSGLHSVSSGGYFLFFQVGKLDAWQTLSFIDIYLVLVAVVALVTCGISLFRQSTRLFFVTGLAALVGVGLIIYRWIDPAIQSPTLSGASGTVPSVSIEPRIGIFAALASAVAIALGSALVGRASDWFESSRTKIDSRAAVSASPGTAAGSSSI
jgi:hypothetical protein